MSFVVLDTDAASHLFRGKVSEPLRRHTVGATLAVTFVTVGELTKWTLVRHWGPQRLTWGDLRAQAQLRGRPRPANDTWVTACCLVRDLPLVTFNRKDFQDFADHDGLELLPG